MTLLDDDKINEQVKATYDISLQANKETDEQTRLRIQLFQYGYYTALITAGILILTSLFMTITAVWCKESLLELKSFWHIPLMLLVSGTSILFVVVRSAASFGHQPKDNTDGLNSLKEQLPIIKEIINLSKDTK